MSSARALLWWPDGKSRLAMTRVIAAAGPEVEAVAKWTGGSLPAGCRLVVVDYDVGRSEAMRLIEAAQKAFPRPSVVVLGSQLRPQDFIDLLAFDCVASVGPKSRAMNASEVVVTIRKIVRGDIFGIEKYLVAGTVANREVLATSDQKNSAVARLTDYLKSIQLNSRLTDQAAMVVDELITNAIYNAPADSAGRAKYQSTARTERVLLSVNETAVLRYGCDGYRLAMSATDNFGRLKLATVRDYLRRCLRRGPEQVDAKRGGAGLGLYKVFESVNALVVNVSPSKRTEMVAIIDVSGNFKEHIGSQNSLHLFVEEPAG